MDVDDLLPGVPHEVIERAAAIQGLVLDVDGVLTDGRLWYGAEGEMMKAIDTRDGHGIVMWRGIGHKTAILSGRPQKLLAKRFAELRIHHLEERCWDKAAGIETVAEALDMSLDQLAYIGDDVNDVPALSRVHLACAPADGTPEAKAASHYVCRTPGGRGAVREVCELLLKARGQWPA